MRYIILRDENADDLAASVERHLAKGWRLHGGVAVSMAHGVREGLSFMGPSLHVVYAQAMSKGRERAK